jgi:DNA-binding phage protein
VAPGERGATASLQSKEDIAAYLDAVLEDGDLELLKAALGDVACVQGGSEAARRAVLDAIRKTARGKAHSGPGAARSQDFLYDENGLPD